MDKNETNLVLLNCVFITALLVSNVCASKIIAIGPFEFSAAVISYPWTFLMTDVIGEIWGRLHARRTVQIGIACQLLSLLLIYIAIALPPASYMIDYADEYREVLGSTARVVLASLIAFIFAQSCDVFLFHKLRSKELARFKWLRNNTSTMISQAVDTVIFLTIAFWGVVPDLLFMIGSQYLIKVLMALLDTPFFYLLTRGSEHQNPVE